LKDILVDHLLYNPINQNALDNEFLKFLCNEGSFAWEVTNLQDFMLVVLFLWKKFGNHVAQLWALALRALTQEYNSNFGSVVGLVLFMSKQRNAIRWFFWHVLGILFVLLFINIQNFKFEEWLKGCA
jgi:hypothetical protein